MGGFERDEQRGKINREKKMSEEKCKHDWVYSNAVLMTNPPIYKKICKKCGKMEEERGDYVDSGEYDRTVKKFIGKNGTYKSLE